MNLPGSDSHLPQPLSVIDSSDDVSETSECLVAPVSGQHEMGREQRQLSMESSSLFQQTIRETNSCDATNIPVQSSSSTVSDAEEIERDSAKKQLETILKSMELGNNAPMEKSKYTVFDIVARRKNKSLPEPNETEKKVKLHLQKLGQLSTHLRTAINSCDRLITHLESLSIRPDTVTNGEIPGKELVTEAGKHAETSVISQKEGYNALSSEGSIQDE